MSPQSAEAHTGRTSVAIVVGTLDAGGAEQSTVQTLAHWPGTDTPVLIVGRLRGPLVAQIPAGTPVHQLSPTWPRPTVLPVALFKLARVVRQKKIQTLVVNSTGVRLLVLLARRLRLIRADVILFERATPSLERTRQRPLLRAAATLSLKALYGGADAHVAVSDGVARDLENALRLPEGSVRTIPSGIDTDAVAQATTEPPGEPFREVFDSLPRPVIVSVGRLEPAKDQATLMRSFAAWNRGAAGSLVILGEGSERADLEQLAQRLGVGDRVHLPGFVTNPHYYVARADLFALTSVYEGMPRVLLEALLCGTRAVSTVCAPGIAELLDRRQGCRTFDVGDVEAGVCAIREALGEPKPGPDSTIADTYGIGRTVRELQQLVRQISGMDRPHRTRRTASTLKRGR
jgi:glycosyltransferase involved in cell wall biosynthesis